MQSDAPKTFLAMNEEQWFSKKCSFCRNITARNYSHSRPILVKNKDKYLLFWLNLQLQLPCSYYDLLPKKFLTPQLHVSDMNIIPVWNLIPARNSFLYSKDTVWGYTFLPKWEFHAGMKISMFIFILDQFMCSPSMQIA